MDEGPSSDGGLSAKYQKLAFEYSKIRAQAQVLKKAVSDEQAKNGELKDVLKEKEQAIRKLEQEVESLNFRNHQLTKRVAFLQDELEGDKGRRNKKKNSASPISQGVFDSELQSRIEENEKLHLQVSTAQLEHRRIVEDLRSELQEAQRAVALRETSLGDALKRQEADIDRLAQDRARLELKLRKCEEDLKAALLGEEISREQLRSLQADLEIRNAEDAQRQTVAFRDDVDEDLNDLNVPATTRRHADRVQALLSALAETVPETVQALSTLHTYMEQRIRLLAMQDCGVDFVQRGPLLVLAQHLHGNVSYLQPIEEAYQSYFDGVNRDQLYLLNGGPCTLELSNALSKYVCYLNKLLPYTVIALRTGLTPQSTDGKTEDLRARLCCTSRKIVAKFSKLERYFQLLSNGGVCPGTEGRSRSAVGYVAVVAKIVEAVRSIWEDFDGAKKELSMLMLAEHHMPTVSVEAKTTNDCIFNSLVAVVSRLGKLSKVLEEKSEVVLDDRPYRRRGPRRTGQIPPLPLCHVSASVSRLRQRAVAYVNRLHREDPPKSVPYQTAIEDAQVLKSHAENRNSFVQQLENLKSKVRKLEEEKVHWMLEWQLLRAKFERQSKDALHSGDGLRAAEGGEVEAIATHLKFHIRDLIEQTQSSDSKATYFYGECQALQQRLRAAEAAQNAAATELRDRNATLQRLKEETTLLTRNYEDQLSSMSEHLASMNEKLTRQQDEIDALRHSGKLGKKSK